MSLLQACGLLCLSQATIILVLAFSSKSSLFRPAAFPIVIGSTVLIFPLIYPLDNPELRALLGGTAAHLFQQYIDTILLSRWEFAEQGPTSDRGGLTPANAKKRDTRSFSLSVKNRLWFGLRISTEHRYVTTKWPVSNIPPFSSADPSYIPSKARFLSTMVLKWLLLSLVIDLSTFLSEDGITNAATFSSAKIPFFARISQVSLEELVTRGVSVTSYWVLLYLVLQRMYCTMALVAVTLNFTAVDAWPPVFSSFSESYSVRRYWGTFWHQLTRRICHSSSYFVTYKLLGLKKGGITGRYLCILGTFTVSGVFHALGNLAEGIPFQESGAMRFFCLQAIAIAMEDAVQAVYRYSGFNVQGRHRLFRFIGFVWVFAWLTWSSPVWIYPSMRTNDRAGVRLFI